MTLHPTRFVLACLSLALLFAPAASAQRSARRPAPTRSLVRKLPSSFEAKPVPGASQEPAADDLDADAAAVFRPREDIEPADVVLSNGEVRVERSDLFILGRAGLNFELRRRYRSQLDYKGPLGYGWDFNYNEQLYDGTGGAKIRLNGAGHVDTWTRNGDGSFNAPAGFFGTLVENSDATFTLREPGGMKHHYKRNGFLSALEDRHGNRISFYYSEGRLVSATDVFGRLIRFFFEASPDGRQRLARVRDFTGREIVYTYDTSGDLVAARSPIIVGTSTGNDFPDGTTERYSYHDDHNLHEVTFPNEVAAAGPPAMVYTYDDEDRVTAWMLGGTNASGVPAGGTATFAYQAQNTGSPLGDPTLARLRTTVVERNGNSYDVDVNELQHRIQSRRFTRGLRPGEPAFYLTRWEHDADGQVTRLIRPRGNGTLYTYGSDSRAAGRDLLELRRVADAVNLSGAEEDIVWTYAYDPVYHQRIATTDPRENSPSYQPPIGSNASGRYTTRRFVDYQEGTDPIPDAVAFGIDLGSFPRGLGDLNADTRTDQTAGSIVRREAPSVTLDAGSPLALELGSTTQAIVTETWWNDCGQRSGQIDPEGNLTEWHYALNGNPGGYPHETIVDSADTYRRTTGESPLALTTTTERDAVGNVTAVLNPRRIRTSFEVNALNELVSTTSGADVSEAPSDQLVTGESAFAFRTEFDRDANGNVVERRRENRSALSVTQGVGNWLETTWTRNILNRVVEASQEVGFGTSAVTALAYDPDQNLIQVTDPEGNVDTTQIDERHLPFLFTEGDGTPVAGTFRSDYDANGNLARQVDAADNDGNGQGEETLVVYDSFDRPTQFQSPLGRRTERAYDPAGNIVQVTEHGHPAGLPTDPAVMYADTRLLFDELGRAYGTDESLFMPTGMTTLRGVDLQDGNADGLVSRRAQFDANGHVLFEVKDLGQVTEFEYDGALRLVLATDPLANTVRLEYDAHANVTRVTETDVSPEGLVAPRAYGTLITYDQLDRQVRTVEPDGSTSYTTYDSLDQVARTDDARGALLPSDPLGVFPVPGQTGQMNGPGNDVHLEYDGLGNVVSKTHNLYEDGEATNPLDTTNAFNSNAYVWLRYSYDLKGRMTLFRDGNGNSTNWEYDSRDRETRRILPNTAAFEYTYDADGNKILEVTPDGFAVQMVHDALNREVSLAVTSAPHGEGTQSIARSFDGLGHVTSSSTVDSELTSTTAAAYDSLRRKREETFHGSLTVSMTHDGNGKIVGLTLADGRTVAYSLDDLDRIKTIDGSVNGPIITSRNYVGSGARIVDQSYGNGVEHVMTYDDKRRPTRWQHDTPGPTVLPLVDIGATWTRTDKLTSETFLSGSISRTFRISSVDLLLGVSESSSTTDYLLDAAGNIRREVINGSFGTVTIDSFFNNMNSLTFSQGATFTHDARGNRTNSGAFQFDYDFAGRFVNAMQGAFGQQKGGYYADSRMAYTITPGLTNDVTLLHVWADGKVVQDWELPPAPSTAAPMVPGLVSSYVYDRSRLQLMDGVDCAFGVLGAVRGYQALCFWTLLKATSFGTWAASLMSYNACGLTLFVDLFGILRQPYTWMDMRLADRLTAYLNQRGGLRAIIDKRNMNRVAPGPRPIEVGDSNGYESAFTPSVLEKRRGADLSLVELVFRHAAMLRPDPAPGAAAAKGPARPAPFVLRMDKKRLLQGREFRIPRFEVIDGVCEQAVCFGVVAPHLGRQPENFEFMAAIGKDFTEVDTPQLGDVLVLDPETGGSHTTFITEVEDGRVGTLGKGSGNAGIEHFDARDFGDIHAPITPEELSFFRRNGRELGAPLRSAITELNRLTKTLPPSSAVPFADHLLYLLQAHNGPDR